MYPIHEMFHTFQGEGIHAGRNAFFIRLFGCDQRCHFCDSAATWHKDWLPEHIEKLTAEEIVGKINNVSLSIWEEYASFQADPDTGMIVVITGGEPTLHNLVPLVELLKRCGYMVHLETAGHHPIPENIDWITLSPKTFATPPLVENLARADEIKLIVENEEGLQRDVDCINQERTDAPVWLHPEWSKRHDPVVLNLITEAVKGSPCSRFRAGYQMHKLYAADFLDSGTRKEAVPLGGDPSNGNSN